MIKTSPMLDIRRTLEILPHAAAVHILEWRGECREVLYILDYTVDKNIEQIPLTAAMIDDTGSILKSMTFTLGQEKDFTARSGLPQKYLYEPGPAFQKAGGFNVMARKYNVTKLHPHTHLYTSAELIPGFPGRTFEIRDIFPAGIKKLPFSKANLAIRNFPGEVAALRKKLRLEDGGEDYVFACTLADESRVFIHGCKPLENL